MTRTLGVSVVLVNDLPLPNPGQPYRIIPGWVRFLPPKPTSPLGLTHSLWDIFRDKTIVPESLRTFLNGCRGIIEVGNLLSNSICSY